MRPSSNFFAALVVALGLSTQAADAAGPLVCQPTDTLDKCSERFNALRQSRAAASPTTESVIAEAKATAAKFNTGPSPAVGEAGAATTNDYLPFIQALLGTNPASGDDSSHLALEFSDFLPLPATIQHKVTIQLLGSELFEPLDKALAAAGHSTERDDLEDGIDASDDFSITLSASPASGEMGRSPENHPEFFEALLTASRQPNQSFADAQKAFETAIFQAMANATARGGSFDPGKLDEEGVGFTAITDTTDRNAVMNALEARERASHADLATIRDNLRTVGFYSALELLSNNSQWNLLANYRSRSETTGPDEWSASLTYEIGWPSLQGARRELGCKDDACLAGKFSNYLLRPSTQRTRNAAPRFSFNLTYEHRARYQYGIESLAFSYSQPSAKSVIGSAAYGQFLTGKTGDKARVRMDFKLSYEDVNDDPAKNNRGVANLTFAYPVAEGMFLTIGAVYATRPEYRGEVDKELGARAGLVYKFANSE